MESCGSTPSSGRPRRFRPLSASPPHRVRARHYHRARCVTSPARDVGVDLRARRSWTSAIALSPAVMFALAALQAGGRQRESFAVEDPPVSPSGSTKASSTPWSHRRRSRSTWFASGTSFRRSHGITPAPSGLPYGGRLLHGTQLPLRGPDWVTWEPVSRQRPESAEAPLRQRTHDPRDPSWSPARIAPSTPTRLSW